MSYPTTRMLELLRRLSKVVKTRFPNLTAEESLDFTAKLVEATVSWLELYAKEEGGK